MSAATAAGGEAADAVLEEIRQILAEVTGRDELRTIPADTALFASGAGLDSLTGALLLREVRRRLGVDVAAEDLSLESLASAGALAAFVAARRGR